MGCSPSKGNNFGTLGAMRKGRMLPPAPQDNPRDPQFEDEENHVSSGATNGATKEKKTGGQTQLLQKESHMTPQKKRLDTEQVNMEAVNIDKLGNQATEKSTVSQRKEKHNDKQDVADKRLNRKPKKNAKGAKVLKKKDKDKLSEEHKVDFPEPLVKAHQAAYAFLNPSINKYDVLLGLLEQAAETQVSVQPMVAFMALRYEEIIQGLEDMVEEGENFLKENGEHLSGSPNIEPPPDLLQQLLQYTTQRMRNVSQTVGRIGDCALEEAVEYFASVSELLEEKLKVKRATESRLMQLLSRIEMASLHKPGPEDSALFSEDSGIGAENESLAGSERRQRRESCESTGTNRATPVSPLRRVSRRKLRGQISPSVSLTSLNSLGSTCTIMANDQRDSLLGSVSTEYGEEDVNDYDEVDRDIGDIQEAVQKQFNCSPVDCKLQEPRRLPPKRIENPQNVEMTMKMKNAISGRIQFVSTQDWTDDEVRSPRRPQTAAAVRKAQVKKTPVNRGQRSRSADSLRSKGEDPTLLELERTQKDLNRRLQSINKSKEERKTRTDPLKRNQGNSPAQSPAINQRQPSLEKKNNPQPPKDKASPTKSNSKKQEATSEVDDDKQKDKNIPKGLIKATPPPSPPLSPQPSSGLHRGRNSVKKLIDTFSQGIEELEGPKVLGPLKGVRKCGVPVLPGLGNVEAVLTAGITSCRSESTTCEKTDLDLDSLPPPAMEVLLDNSFESAQSTSTSVAADGATKVGRSPLLKRGLISQRLKASVQSVMVLPSKGGLPQTSKHISPVRVEQQETFPLSKVNQPDSEIKKDSLYQQLRKNIQLKPSSNSQSEKLSTSYVGPCVTQTELRDIQDDGNISVPGSNTTASSVPASVETSQTPATPPVSRGRMLPSTPSTPSSLHRRLPSPHNFKNQPTPPSSSSPSLNRTLPTPPALQRRLPSPPVSKQNISSSNSVASYPFKAPSPPASPKVQRWSRENSSEDSSSTRTISNARSVFCPVSLSMFEAQPCSVSKPPQAWTSTKVSFLLHTFETRGRTPASVHGPRPFIRRSHSDRRQSLSLPQQSQRISVAETCGSEPAIYSQG
uniref:Photoreceptor cilium actin regulator n=1 Tax=Haplochromis burtoni TaxID=8153 RepID=A0A3Q2VP70_HAPBU